jgi:nucleoside-diphosphate-sugar epimerase
VEAHVSLPARILAGGRFERFVYLSSTRPYQTTGADIGREDDPLAMSPGDPEQLYELSKVLGENLAVHRTGGRGCAARLSYVFDWRTGAAGFLSDWLQRARATREIPVPSTPQDGRDYIHVDDVVLALRALADGELNAIVNVASGRNTTNAQIAEVFTAAGWRIEFTGRAPPAPGVAIDTAQLAALGVRPQPPLDLIRSYLAGL